MTPKFSASRLNDFLGCAHQAALWLAGVAPPKETDATIELVRQKGFEHEAKVLAQLEKEHGAATLIPGKGAHAEREAATHLAIKNGAKLIYQGALSHDGWIGYPDFLIKQPETDGKLTYQPEDAKLARKAKPEYLLQLGVYAELLQATDGFAVKDGVVHVFGGAPQPFDLRKTKFILRRLIRTFEAFAKDEKRVSRPVPCAACSQCDYKPRCEAEWRAADSPYFVAEVSSSQVVKLEEAGVKTLAALAALKDDVIVEGIGSGPLKRVIGQARLQLKARAKGEHFIEVLPHVAGRGFALLPPSDPGDLFFDMEGDPHFEEGLEYLFGVWGALDGNKEGYSAFWAHDHKQEKAAFEQFMQFLVAHLQKHPAAHVYHYAAYEPSKLKRLAMRYATFEAELDDMLRGHRFVDLYRVVKQSIRASTEGYSLKDLEQIYRGKREGSVTSAGASIVEYERWRVANEQAILDSIAAYNQDDCVSTKQLRNWLEPMRPAGVIFGEAEDKPEKAEKTAERIERERRKQELAQLVRASGVGDERLRELVAELLWFHQRAQKPGWWAAFERQAWSEDELIEDAESLGGLFRDPDIAAVKDKQSMEVAYRFPPQDTKLRERSTPKIADTLASAGTVVSLDAEEGRLVLRRGIRSGPLPDKMNLIPAPLDQHGIPDAVFAFAARFAQSDLAADSALMDFLQRNPPRLKGRAPGGVIQAENHDPGKAAMSAVSDLDNSYVFIQGPPGTGKTYTAAEIIVQLLKAGYRIGVTSNSHKAINNALKELEECASAAKLHFTGAKRGSKDDPDTHFDSAHIKTVLTSELVTPIHRVVGGTVFHFYRDDQRGQFDYLIVDEAGQVALGNLVAMAGCARNIVLVGDQMQLPQPVQGVHPGETGLSCLDYLLEGKATVSPDRGILLNESRRLHPDLCQFISEAIYDGRLRANPLTASRSIILSANPHSALQPAGISFLAVKHDGCTQSSPEEATAISNLIQDLLRHQRRKADGSLAAMSLKDILVVAPYNMQVNLLRERLPKGTAIGTVDKFQGQQASVVIVSMTTSSGQDAPRGTEFLFNPNRFNVAVSRAECLAIVVHGKNLLEGAWKNIEDLKRLNLFAHAESIAKNVSV